MASTRICSIDGCDKRVLARGWCRNHYYQWYKKSILKARHPLYALWCRIIDRCCCPTSAGYYKYGGRGIRVCDRWQNDFLAFEADMPSRPSLKHSIERINNDKGYEPGNCRWATAAEQTRNQRSNILITINGETRIVADWAAEARCPVNTIYGRKRRGWSDYDAVMVPSGQWRKDNELRGSLTDKMKASRSRNPDAEKAHLAVNKAIKAGRLVRQPCQECGDIFSEAHHEDYSKPLEVEWLCHKHHKNRAKNSL